MEKKEWVKLDNASNIFLAARNETDTKVFRMTVDMTETVNPVRLQSALIQTYKEYPLFQTVLRRGVFWYYLEQTEATPRVRLETEPPCRPIYHYDRREFLFRVLYYENKIHLEVFHALTDGTGAMWFFEDLITEYIRLNYTKQLSDFNGPDKRNKADLEDSFRRYFRKKKKQMNLDTSNRELENLVDEDELKKLDDMDEKSHKELKVYQVRGEKTPDHRPRIVEMNLPIKEALALSRKHNVSLTIYMTALFIVSVYLSSDQKEKETTITTSIPINLRQFFPSVSVRNFFSTTTVWYTFKKDEEIDMDKICQKLSNQFLSQLEKDALENRLRRYIAFEINPFARVIIRPIKDSVLKIINKASNRKVTVAMSNLGRANLPDETRPFIKKLYFYTSVIRPQFCMISFDDQLILNFTTPYVETSIQREFVRLLTERGIPVSVDVNKVTREELED